ncbi:multicopper oxidase family protein [Streptomyces antimicrobicus]|uniref:Multicopper oxidase CueO n=1 Tax=Streptomyces antimicrobicus TaxID=2883108 RepID=A0ABS8B1N9_9ACTN|nr:multicopper oxidase domain-containing protein [Streptomyces antimicrobicus]MCB5178529.1 multicopper oxidase domain-containing protein [Streptomyces antimicrobicus]
MVTRRSVLGGALAATGAGLLTGGALMPLLSARTAQAAGAGSDGSGGAAAVAVPAPFTVRMPTLPVLSPISTLGGQDLYYVTIKEVAREILPGVQTKVLTYDGHFPGPVLRARSGRKVVVRHRNTLGMPIAVHLHGGSVSPENDGSPMDTVAPGTSRTYTYPNQQPHAPLWFHDHAHHMESEHVYRGLSGSYLLTDDVESALPLPSGQYEVPIALRDARFDAAGQLVYVMDDVFGRTTILANGRPTPYFPVAARKYRFRLLNSSNMRFFQLRLSDGGPLVQIGTDGGLLERPFTTDTVGLSPAERADVVIDFSRYPVGTKIVLENTLGPGTPDQVGQVLRFDVVRTAADPSRVPDVLRTLPPLPAATVERNIVLSMDEDGRQEPRGLMDGQVWDPDRIDQTVTHGTSEIWTVTNANKIVPHNFHMHLVQFRVLERGGAPVGPAEAGLKDTVRLFPGETVKLHATFASYRGTYVYHCHLLDHSAMGMMANFRVR